MQEKIYKSHIQYQQQPAPPQPFLQAITALGCSGETTVSEQVSEILKQEIDPIKGWNLK